MVSRCEWGSREGRSLGPTVTQMTCQRLMGAPVRPPHDRGGKALLTFAKRVRNLRPLCPPVNL